jgi:putative hydrolase of the HAD superfamily
MPTYKHIFWDLDHTLWDFEKNSVQALQLCYQHFELDKKGVAPFDAFNINYHEHNDKMWDKFRKGELSREDLRWKRMHITLLDYKIDNEVLAKEMSEQYLIYLPQQTHLFAGAVEILNYCKEKGYEQHMITNGFELTQIAKMTNSNIYHFIDKLITSEQAGSMKPHAAIYQYALAQVKAQNADCLMIGDDEMVDALGATAIGMDAVWFNVKTERSKSVHAKHVISQLLHLKKIL